MTRFFAEQDNLRARFGDFFSNFPLYSTMSSRTQLLTPSNLRLDSRMPLELRALSLSISPSPSTSSSAGSSSALPLAGADGQANCQHGLTRVSATIFGPREPLRGTGPFTAGDSASASAPGKEGKAQVNVEVGTAGWAERGTMQGSSSTAGIRKGGKDRWVQKARRRQSV